MGRTPDGEGVMKHFYPNNEVTKAETVTIISRLFRKNEYKNRWWESWYARHLKHLVELGVVEDEENMNYSSSRKYFYKILKKIYTLNA